MGLPTQVQAALDAADATLAEANGQPPTSFDQPDPAPDVPEPFAQQSTPEPQANVVAKPPEPTPADDVWRARYNSLQGLFNKEVPALQQQVKSLQSDLSAAVDRLNRASEQKEQQPQMPEVSAKDVDNFGQDLVDMVSRVAGQSVDRLARLLEGKVAKFESDIATLQNAVSGTHRQMTLTAEQMFFADLEKLVPNYREINQEAGFHEWLAEPDPVYGVPRQTALARAQEQHNAEHVARIFRAFAPDAPAKPKRDPVESQMSPRATATPTVTQSNDKQMVTQKQIVAFYDDVSKGRYRGQEAEAARIEALINTALAEGRVR